MEIKEALIKEYAFEKDEMQVAFVLKGSEGLKAFILKKYPKRLVIKNERFGDSKYSKEELTAFVLSFVQKNNFFEHTYTTIEEMLLNKGTAIKYLPANAQTEKLQFIALDGGASLRDIKEPTNSIIIRASFKPWFEAQFTDEMAAKLNQQELVQIIRNNPAIVVSGFKPRPFITKELFYCFLEVMVREHHDFILGYPNTIYTDYMDAFAYKCYCMVNGFNFTQIPKEFRQQVVSEKLINYCLDHESSYVSPLHLIEAIPENYKTREICRKACVAHFAAIQYVPKEYLDTEFYEDLMICNQYNFLEYHPDIASIPKNIISMVLKEKPNAYLPDNFGKILDANMAEDLAIWEKALSIIPTKLLTKKICMTNILLYGTNINKVPDQFIDMEMCKAAVASSQFALKYIPNEYVNEELYRYMNVNGYFTTDQLPQEYLTEDGIILAIQNHCISNIENIPKEYRTKSVLETLYKEYPGSYEIDPEFSNIELCRQALLSKKTAWERYFAFTKLSPENRPLDILEDILKTHKAAIHLKDLTEEQISLNLSHFPENIIYVPDWYLANHKNASATETVVVPVKSNPESKKIQSVFSNIVLTDFKQLSLFDIIAG